MPSPWIRLPPRPETPTGSPRRRRNRSSIDRTCGSSVEPGTPLSKAQKEARKDSRIAPLGLDGQSDANNDAPREDFAWLATKMRLDSTQLDVFAPEADPYTSEDFLHGRAPGNLRALIIFVILFLIIFGAIYEVVGYLLFAVRATASCTPSTVYVPVTRYVSTSAAAPAVESSTSMLTIYSTATEYATTTSYLTLQPAVVATSSDGGHYYFTTDSAGSTGWLNGISPPATASLTLLTTSIFVTPVVPTETLSTTTATITSTAVIYQTLTVPAYTSTTYSLVEPYTTLTSTSTHYVTYTVSKVSTGDVPTTTGPRASYSGPGMSGWNSSNSNAPEATGIAAAAEGDPQLTTMTEIHYWGEGDMTTSTRTNFITTSIRVAYTTVITPSIPEPSDNPDFVTTVTALPVTITYSSGEQYSTSIAFNGTAVTTVAPTSQASTSGPFQTGVSATAPSPGSGSSSAPAVTQSSSSGIFTNSTNAVTLSAAGYSTGAISILSPSSSSIATNGSSVGPVASGSSSSKLLSSSLVPTAPGPISTSTTVSQVSSSSSTGQSSLSSTASATSASSSTTIETSSGVSSGSPATSSVVNTTSTSSGVSGSSAAITTTSSASSSSTYGAPTLSAPIYGSYSPLTSSSVATTIDPISASSSSTASSSFNSSTVSASSLALTGSMASSTWSTSIRSQSSSTSSSASLSQPTSSPSLPDPNITVGISSAITATESLDPSVSLISWSQTYIPSSTSSLTGIPASAASSMPTTGCGEYGDFMLDFDNLPNFTPSNQNQTDITQAPPIQNPYHHFAFSDGYVYAPDPKVPFEPISQPHLAVFLGNGTGMRATQSGHTIEDGEFANGPYEASSAFWFDAFSGWLGCDNEGPEVCTLVMNAYTYDAQSNDEVLAFTQNTTIPGCPGFKDCKLQKVEFPNTFRKLSGLQIQAYVKDEERMFFMDDVAMRWTDNSCVAGLTRQRAR